MGDLVVTVTHDSLDKDIVLTIKEGNGFADNAARLGWQAEIPPAQATIDAAQQKVLDAPAGSQERLQAQRELQALQSSTVPNPESPVFFLCSYIRTQIDSVLVDPADLQARREAAEAAIKAELEAALDAKRVIKYVDKPAP